MQATVVKRSGKKRRGRAVFLIALLLVTALFMWLDNNLRPVILAMAEAQARVMAVSSMNRAVFDIMRDGSSYAQLVEVTMDTNGRVAMMQANTARMNELSTQVALKVQDNLSEIAEAGISIPLGAALGSRLLGATGPRIHVGLIPVGAVITEFYSEFTAAGINQTRHRIFLAVETTVQMIIPTGTQTAKVVAQVPVAESIIVGDVPQSFIDVNDTHDSLSLLSKPSN